MSNYKEKISGEMYKRNLHNLHRVESSKITATKLLNKEIIAAFKKHGCNRILEAGCGEGRFLEMAQSNGLIAEGFDNNKALVNVCKRKKLNVSQADIEKKFPYKSNSFDGIYCTNVLEHVQDPAFGLYEFQRILRKKGLLIVAVPEYSKSFYDDWTHKRPFTRVTLQRLAKAAGFRNFNIKKRHFPFLVAHWNNPLVRAVNVVGSKGPFAVFVTAFIEKFLNYHRHDLVLEAVK